MYVIYPADELINFLSSREYVSSQSSALASPLSTAGGSTAVLLRQNSSGHPAGSPSEDSDHHESIQRRRSVTSLEIQEGTAISASSEQEDHLAPSSSDRAPCCKKRQVLEAQTTDPRDGKPSRPRLSKLSIRSLNFRPFRKCPEEAQSGIHDNPVKPKDNKVVKGAGGRLIAPTVTLTPITGAFDDHFVNYRDQNSNSSQRIKLLHSPLSFHKSKSSDDQSSPNSPANHLLSGFNYARRGTQQVSLSRASSPGVTSSKTNTMLGATQSNSGTMSNLPVTNLITDPSSLKDLLHPSLNETLKGHNALTFKLIRIVSDFTQQLSQLHEQHAVELQLLVDNFRKRSAELRKERPPCSSSLFQVWETLLQEVEIDSQAHSDLSGSLGRQVARPLLEKTFCRKIQSRKIFAHRESFETVLNKTETLLSNTYREYCDACMAHIQQGTSASLANYIDAHNAYVLQLRGTNAMLKEYQSETLPALLKELDEIYIELCSTLSESVLQGAEIIASRMQETNRRYESLVNLCRSANGEQDLQDLVNSIPVPVPPNQRHAFTQPVPLLPSADGADLPSQDRSYVPVLKDEVLTDRLAASSSARSRQETLRKEMMDLEAEMKQLQDSLDTLLRMQHRSLDSSLYNKANELQEEISMKRFDLRLAQMHMAALWAQIKPENSGKALESIETGGTVPASGASSGPQDKNSRERKMSGSSNATMKNKWMKALRGITQTPTVTSKEPESDAKPEKKNQMFLAVTAIMMMRKNGKEKDKNPGESFQIFENHIFQEYTYKKITPCDMCSQVLRGHTKQGLRCRLCKLNVHVDCQEKVSKCVPKTRLLRRQRSTSELETKLTQMAEQVFEEDAPKPTSQPAQGPAGGENKSNEPDLIYQVLKQATDMKKPGGSSSGSGSGNGIHGSSQTLYSQHESAQGALAASRRSNPSVNTAAQGPSGLSGASAGSGQAPSSSAPHSPRRRKLDLRMKSFSLDSPESTEHAQRRRYAHGTLRPSCSSHAEDTSKEDMGSQCISQGEQGDARYGLHAKSANVNSAYSYSSVNLNCASSPPSSLLTPSSTPYDAVYVSDLPQTQTQAPAFASLNHFAPSSPVHNRRALLTTRSIRMSSVELPDEQEKSLSSASTSPCPSPKPHRLLPTNLYVCLYMFKARHPDELDLKAGYKVTVTDTSDPDWWQGKCMGRVGYFPSKYVTKLQPGEKALQVTHNLQVTDGAENGLKLLRDQIVIQVGEELDGMVTIRNGENKQGICPLKYLQEV